MSLNAYQTTDALTPLRAADGEGGAHACSVNLREPSAPGLIIKESIEAFGNQIDILVNNAGCELVRPAEDITASDFAHVYDLNVRGVSLMTAAVIPHLPSSGYVIPRLILPLIFTGSTYQLRRQETPRRSTSARERKY